jgi:hypothetical protein
MKASEVIELIQKAIDEVGDLPIELCTEEAFEQIEAQEVCIGSYGKYSDKPNRQYIAIYSYKQ